MYGIWAMSAAVWIGIVGHAAQLLAVERAHPPARGDADRVHQEVARAVEHDDRGAQLLAEVAASNAFHHDAGHLLRPIVFQTTAVASGGAPLSSMISQ